MILLPYLQDCCLSWDGERGELISSYLLVLEFSPITECKHLWKIIHRHTQIYFIATYSQTCACLHWDVAIIPNTDPTDESYFRWNLSIWLSHIIFIVYQKSISKISHHSWLMVTNRKQRLDMKMCSEKQDGKSSPTVTT